MASSPSGPGSSGQRSDEPSIIHIKNLPEQTKLEDLRRLFGQFGHVEDIQINIEAIAKIRFDSHQNASNLIEPSSKVTTSVTPQVVPTSYTQIIRALDKCALCGLPTALRCSICKIQYCSSKCQSDHWPAHRPECSVVPPSEKTDGTTPQKILRRPLVRPLVRPAPLRQTPISPIPTRRVPRDTNPEVEVFKEEGTIMDGGNAILTGHIQDVVEQNPTCIGRSTPIPSEYNQTSLTSSPRHSPTGVSISTYLSARNLSAFSKLLPGINQKNLNAKTSSPEKIKLSDLRMPKFRQGDFLDAISFDRSTNRLIVAKLNQEENLDHIAKALSRAEKTPLETVPEKSQVVLCKWVNGDGEYYRAVVTSVNTAIRKVKIQFVDYGNRSVEEFHDLAILPPDLTQAEFPCAVTTISLADVPEVNLKKNKDLEDNLISLLATVGGQSLVVTNVEVVNGVQLFTLATTDRRQIINKILKNVLLENELAAVQLPASSV